MVKKNSWKTFVDIITVLWIITFLAGLFANDTNIVKICNYVNLLFLPIFIFDLIFLYRRNQNIKTFITEKWLDILMVIPYFRVFRILRMVKTLRILKIVKVKKILKIFKFSKKTARIICRQRKNQS